MDGRQFDALVRDATEAPASRRGWVLGLVAGATAALLGHDAEAGKRRRRRRRRRRNTVRVCFKGRELVLDRAAARELVSRGAQRGRCRPLPGEGETCESATPTCSTDHIFCGSACVCFTSTMGELFCGDTFIECVPGQQTCVFDDDCVNRFGDGFHCVPTDGCGDSIPGCNDFSNACVGPCGD